MTRFPNLHSLLTGEPIPASDRSIWLTRYAEARGRGDTRSMHDIGQRLGLATTDQLRREIGR